VRPALRTILRATGLLAPARAGRRLARALRAWPENARVRRAGAPDGLPLPPATLVDLVAGTPYLRWFLDGGTLAAASIREALAEQSTDVAAMESVLDFGCGCGRVLRHWSALRGALHGCDYNKDGIRWCQANLPFARCAVNALDPPLPYADRTFDLAYALSVFTHLPEALQRPWVDELFRVVRPGGFCLISVHGQRYLPELTEEQQQEFRRGQLVVVRSEDPGTNLCAAYHPEDAMRRLVADRFEVRAVRREGARGNPHQDLVVLRRL
jgi:SAM-dependent methyltransferase